MSGALSGWHDWGGRCCGIEWVAARDALPHPPGRLSLRPPQNDLPRTPMGRTRRERNPALVYWPAERISDLLCFDETRCRVCFCVSTCNAGLCCPSTPAPQQVAGGVWEQLWETPTPRPPHLRHKPKGKREKSFSALGGTGN